MTPQLITPVLWFNGTAGEAVDFYLDAFEPLGLTMMLHTARYPAGGLDAELTQLGGEVATVDFRLANLYLRALNTASDVEKNPSISFTVLFDPSVEDDAEVQFAALWEKLSGGEDAMVLMPDSTQYPFADRFGWVADRFGVSWQLTLNDGARAAKPDAPRIMPSFMFGGPNVNNAKAAVSEWVELFPGSEFTTKVLHDEDTGPARAGSIMYSEFQLAGQWFTAMDAGAEQPFTFVPSISLAVAAEDQADIDRYWEALAAEPGKAGWATDQWGISWQVLPADLPEILAHPGAFHRMQQMDKIDIDGMLGEFAE